MHSDWIPRLVVVNALVTEHTSTKDEHGHTKLGQELHAASMALQAQVETAQAVPGQGVSPATNHNGLWLEHLHDLQACINFHQVNILFP